MKVDRKNINSKAQFTEQQDIKIKGGNPRLIISESFPPFVLSMVICPKVLLMIILSSVLFPWHLLQHLLS